MTGSACKRDAEMSRYRGEGLDLGVYYSLSLECNGYLGLILGFYWD